MAGGRSTLLKAEGPRTLADCRLDPLAIRLIVASLASGVFLTNRGLGLRDDRVAIATLAATRERSS